MCVCVCVCVCVGKQTVINWPPAIPPSTLAQYLKQRVKPLSEEEILTMFYQMVDALKYLHDHKILHR